jgi:hypothetical protein
MLRFQWNALRPGDRVAVHDDRQPTSPLQDGHVVFVQKVRGGSDVAVRVTDVDTGQRRVVRPPRLTVHLVSPDQREPCWRCDDANS